MKISYGFIIKDYEIEKHLLTLKDFILTEKSLTLIIDENDAIIEKNMSFDSCRFISTLNESILFFNIKQPSYFIIDFIVTESNKSRIKSLMVQLRDKFLV